MSEILEKRDSLLEMHVTKTNSKIGYNIILLKKQQKLQETLTFQEFILLEDLVDFLSQSWDYLMVTYQIRTCFFYLKVHFLKSQGLAGILLLK